jgi:hypothetical protein
VTPGGRRPPWFAVAGIAAGFVAAAVGVALLTAAPHSKPTADRSTSNATTTTPPAARPATTPAAAPWRPALGVYAGPDAVAAAQAFGRAVGGPVTDALDFLPSSNWGSIADPQWTIDRWQGSPFHMIYGVPMLPDTGASLATGATGAYDLVFASLATHLVAAGQSNATLMIGWDPLQPGTTWQVQGEAEAAEYIAYWRHIVASVRAVPGAQFTFEWDGGTPIGSPLAPSAAYPGNAYVSLIATNAFDQVVGPTAGPRWAAIAEATNGPDWFAEFAADHHKPLVVGEWGLEPVTAPGGGGDDGAFVTDLMAWCAANRVALVVTWDYGAWSVTSGSFPSAQATLAHATTAVDTPASTAPVIGGPQAGT